MSAWAKTARESRSSRTAHQPRTSPRPKPANRRPDFVDTARIHVRAGQGGKGSSSFRREPFVPRGGPDGGDGGRGGSVLVKATTSKTDLSAYLRHVTWRAADGGDGRGSRKTGGRGSDLTLEVPVGTVVIDEDGKILADLAHPGAVGVAALGGAGGRGNAHFKSSTRRAPDFAEPGRKGDDRWIGLDLKLIADVGLVGPPNAGKSSLLASLTAARPKVADYPFTTLNPELGVAVSPGGRIVIAEIPGLVEGASKGSGLGLRFLRHLERTRLLVFVVDGSQPAPWETLNKVQAEVKAFSPGLARRPHVIAVNKLDLEAVRDLRAHTRRKGVIFVSALSGEGLDDLMTEVFRALASAPQPELTRQAAPAPRRPVVAVSPQAVERHTWGFTVTGSAVEHLVATINPRSDVSLQRFQTMLDKLGVNVALEAAGARSGDTVRIAGVEFEYRP